MPDTFSISLAGPQGQIVGGFVAGPLIAVGNVFVITATFTNPSFHRLPGEEESRNPVSSGGGGEGGSQTQSPPMSGGGAESGGHHGGGESVSMYSCHNMGGSEGIWTPNARPPPPPPY